MVFTFGLFYTPVNAATKSNTDLNRFLTNDELSALEQSDTLTDDGLHDALRFLDTCGIDINNIELNKNKLTLDVEVGDISNSIIINSANNELIKMEVFEGDKHNVIELDDEKCPENLSEKDMLIVKDKEGKKILSKIKNNSYVIALAIDGKNLSSEELADTMSKLAVRGNSHITFVIGGSLGLSDEVLKRADYKLSFSKMTFPHQLMRLILLEQVYRAFRINNNEPYHK